MTATELYIQILQAREHDLPAFVLQVRRKRYRSNRIRIGRSLPARIIGGNNVGYFVSVDVKDAERFCARHAPEDLLPARVQLPEEKLSPELRLDGRELPADPWKGVPA